MTRSFSCARSSPAAPTRVTASRWPAWPACRRSCWTVPRKYCATSKNPNLPPKAMCGSQRVNAPNARSCKSSGRRRNWICSGANDLRYRLNPDRRALERGELKSVKVFVVTEPLVAQDADGRALAQFHRFDGVGAPVDPGKIASERDVRRDLVQFSAHREWRSAVRQQRKTIWRGLNRVG